MKKGDKRAIAAAVVLCGLIGLISTRETLTEEERFARDQMRAAEEYERRRPVAASVDAISGDERQMAVDTIELEADVIDAAVSQSGRKLTLALVVRSGMSEGRARQLGDSFVRLVKTFGPDDSPSSEIGRGRYDYLVGVQTIDGARIATGAKDATSPRIAW